MNCYKYCVFLSDDMDRDYEKTGLVFSDNKEKAEELVYQYYEKRTTDYVYRTISLEKITISNGLILEDFEWLWAVS